MSKENKTSSVSERAVEIVSAIMSLDPISHGHRVTVDTTAQPYTSRIYFYTEILNFLYNEYMKEFEDEGSAHDELSKQGIVATKETVLPFGDRYTVLTITRREGPSQSAWGTPAPASGFAGFHNPANPFKAPNVARPVYLQSQPVSSTYSYILRD